MTWPVLKFQNVTCISNQNWAGLNFYIAYPTIFGLGVHNLFFEEVSEKITYKSHKFQPPKS